MMTPVQLCIFIAIAICSGFYLIIYGVYIKNEFAQRLGLANLMLVIILLLSFIVDKIIVGAIK